MRILLFQALSRIIAAKYNKIPDDNLQQKVSFPIKNLKHKARATQKNNLKTTVFCPGVAELKFTPRSVRT